MTKPLNVGFLGFGFIGKVHAYGYLNLPLHYDPVPFPTRITHICTSRQETAEKGAAQVGADVATTDFKAITENPDIDIVHICTPNNRHRDELLSAMAHQKHIYCDKPITAQLSEASEVEKALDAYEGIAQMTFQYRFYPATMRAKQLMEDGFVGEVLSFRASYLHSGSVSPTTPLKWKLSGTTGGGVIADLGAHVFDLMHHLLGDFASMSAATHQAYAERPSVDDSARNVVVDAEDQATVLLRLPNGALGTLEFSKIATGTEDELRFEIHGTYGAIRFNLMAPHYLEVYDLRSTDSPIGGKRGWTTIDTGQRYPAPAATMPSPKCAIGWMRGHMACLANFLYAIAKKEQPEPSLKQGIYIQHLIHKARESASSQAWIDCN